ncbi:MAG: glycoside hydrolase family 2 TIM barrel-domain containing protein [Chitinophagaceae bacterium]
MNKKKIFLGLLLMPMTILSQGLLINTNNRNITSLNGNWNYIVDPYETGYYSFHSEIYDQKNPGSPSAFYNNYHPKDKAELVEYDFDKSPTLKVPGDWNTQKENLFYYEGTIWLKKSFDYNLKTNKRIFVYFGAINYKADVYLNGKKLGTHEGGFTPFNFEVTSVIKEKGNYIVVKVDNKRFKEAVPTTNTDWWNYGGITRDVLLIEEPAVFIQDYSLQLKKGNNKSMAGYVQLNKANSYEKLLISIPELKIEKEMQTGVDGKATFELDITNNIKYWSPESPKLYTVQIISAYQTLRDEIGFRTIETKGPDILLNGKSVYLRGICMHEDFKGRRANGEADAIAMLTWAKEMGCNYVRLAHYPHNEHILRMADKMGLMVWEEIPVYWTIDFKNDATYSNAKNQLTEVITRDKNRACVIIWSMANETPLSEARNSFLLNLINHTKTLDTTRLLSAALLTRSEKGVGMVDDKIGEYLDIISFNQYRGWYGGDLKTAPDAKWVTPYNKPVVVSEFGGSAKQGLHGPKEERWNEEYQEYLYQQNLLMIEKIPNIRGISPWILTDFRSPRRLLPGIQDGFNRKGLISSEGKKKKAFFILKSFYKKMELQYK